MSWMILEVDGSIRNPAVAWAIGLWTFTLVITTFLAARRFRRNRRTRFTFLAALLVIATPVAVKIIAALFYILPAGSFASVHFWGFSRLQWLGPAASVLVFGAVALWPRRHVAVA